MHDESILPGPGLPDLDRWRRPHALASPNTRPCAVGVTLEASGQRDAEQDGHGEMPPLTGAARVVVVGSDEERIAQYQAALGLAQVPFRTTLDTAEAETLIGELPLEVLVLDLGLPRLALLQLYSQARSLKGGSDVQVLFVGQDGDTGPDDHFLPGEPSPVTVSSWVSDLVAGVTEPPALDLGLDDSPARTADVADVAVVDEVPVVASVVLEGIDEDPPAADDAPRSVDVPPQADHATTPGAAVADEEPAILSDGDGAPDTGTVAAGAGAASAIGPGETAAEHPVPGPSPDQPEAPSRRTYVVLVRIGLVLLVLGALLMLVRLEWNPPAITPPAAVPTAVPDAAPTPTGRGVAPAQTAWALPSVVTPA